MTPPRTAPGASRRRVFAGASALAGAAAMGIDAHAHGFGQRYDLPVPLSLYLTGAAAVVAVSFLIMAIFFRRVHAVADYPRVDVLRFPGGRMLAHPVIRAALRTAAVFLLILVVAAGFFGNPAPVKNIAPIMVWAIWWVGMAYVCALLGNLWALVNPLDTIFAWVERIYARLHHGAALARGLRYPQALGAWPAVALFFGFAWAELIWDQSDRPAYVAAATLAYCAITWTGMLLYGRRAWLAHGEVFALIFALLGRFAPLEARMAAGRAELNLRPYAVGLLIDEPVHTSLMVLVVMMLATVTFDGFMETPLWVEIADQMSVWLATPGAADGPHAIVATLGLAGMMLAFQNIAFRKFDELGISIKIAVVFVGCFACAAVLSALGVAPIPAKVPPVIWSEVVAFGLVWLLLASIGTLWGVAHMEAGRSSILIIMELVTAVVSAALLSSRSLSLLEWLGGGLIILAALLEAWRPGESGAK